MITKLDAHHRHDLAETVDDIEKMVHGLEWASQLDCFNASENTVLISSVTAGLRMVRTLILEEIKRINRL